MLAQSNVPPAVAMKILRHRDVRLTLMAYTDESLLSTAAAMASLPSLGIAGTNGAPKRAQHGLNGAHTGTGA